MVVTINGQNITLYENESLTPQLRGIIDDDLLEIIQPALDGYQKYKEAVAEVAELEDELNHCERFADELQTEVDSKDIEIEELEDRILRYQKKLNDKNKTIRELKKRIIFNG